METRLNIVLQGMACDKNKVSGTRARSFGLVS